MKEEFAHGYDEFNSVGHRMNEILFAKEKPEKCLVALVCHSFFSSRPEIEAAERIAGKENLVIYLKNSSKNKAFERYLIDEGYNVSNLNKQDFKQHPDRVTRELKNHLDKKHLDKLMILDHGGYFSYHIKELSEQLPISGLIEYTVNGQNKYDKIFELNPSLDVNYASIGKSRLKRFSDYSCGKLIGSLTQQIVQEYKGFGVHLKGISRIGIIGFGKLGSKAAEKLRLNGAENIMVYDDDPEKMIEASQQGFDISAKNVGELLSQCNILMIGTDTMPIKAEMYEKVRDDTVISTVTSSDDSLGLDQLIDSGALTPKRGGVNGKINQYLTKNGKTVNLIYNGEASNMMTGIGVDDPTIFMPTIHHALVGMELAKGNKATPELIHTLENNVMESYIATIREKQKELGCHVG